MIPQSIPAYPLPLCEVREVNGRAGRMALHVWGPRGAPPLLLIHSINAAAGVHELWPLISALAGTHRIYAPDLPGFGASDRSDRPYNPRLYEDGLRDVMDQIAADGYGEQPVDALALSLSSEFLGRVALERPERFRRLVFVTPTGFMRGSSARTAPLGTTREVPGMYRIVAFPLWSQGLFNALTRRGSVHYFLKRTFGSDAVPDWFVEAAWRTAQAPGGRFAPLAFLSGRLFGADIARVYQGLTPPVWVAHGTRGDFKDFSDRAWTETRDNWRFSAYPTGALVHVELPERFVADLNSFLSTPLISSRPAPDAPPAGRAP